MTVMLSLNSWLAGSTASLDLVIYQLVYESLNPVDEIFSVCV